jgi:TonB family protein
MTKKDPQKIKNISLAIGLSLAIHLALGAAMIIGLSSDLHQVAGWNKLALVWVNLDNGSKGGSAITQNHSANISSAAEKITTQTEKPAIKPVREAVETFALNTQSQSIITSGGNINSMTTNVAASAAESGGNLSARNSGTPSLLSCRSMLPIYPEIARLRGYEGTVQLAAEILPDGRVGSIKIKKSSGYAILDQSAIEFIRPCKYEQDRKSGKPYTVWLELPITFVLHDNNQS